MQIEFKEVSKTYKKKYALKDFSSQLTSGIYGLLGTNGAGKTTLINIFVGITECDCGEILVDGRNVRELGSDFLRHIGYLPQYPQFYKNFAVYDFLHYMCIVKDIAVGDREERINWLLDTVNLNDARNKKIGALSGGMRQRLGIAQAMLNDPSILILDEPTAGLDPQERIRFRNLISKFSENRIILLATHIVTDVEFIANEVILLRKGEKIKQDPPLILTEDIHGKVWNVVVDEDQADEYIENYQISNIYRENGKVHLRVIAKSLLEENGEMIQPNLEEVFLYHFSEDTKWSD